MDTLRLFPLGTVFFPGATMNIHVFEERFRRMVRECLEQDVPFGIALIREGGEAGDPAATPHSIGTEARIMRCDPLPEGRFLLDVRGERRFSIVRVVSREPYLLAEVEYLSEPPPTAAAGELVARARAGLPAYVDLLAKMANVELELPDLPDDPVSASYVIAQTLQTNDAAKQRLLEVSRADERLRAELAVLQRATAALERIAAQRESAARGESGGNGERKDQERLFGVYFSPN
ncbi:MAG: LON peptidase substrate-binding domain-containing protein [bacterium]|nr:LON peptidase substrate-binding domain-containing protein [bacterium]